MTTQAREQQHSPQDEQQPRRMKQQGENAILGQGRSSMIRDIRRTITSKHNQVFMLTSEGGDILPHDYGHGLFFHDTCYLDQLELRLCGQLATSLLGDASTGAETSYELTNYDLDLGDNRTLSKERLSIRRTRDLRGQITERIDVHNLDQQKVELDLTLTFNSHFTNMFVIRGAEPGKRGTLHQPQTSGNKITLAYDGADHRHRETIISLAPNPRQIDGGTATYRIQLEPHARTHLTITYELVDKGEDSTSDTIESVAIKATTTNDRHQEFDQRISRMTRIETDNPLFDRALQRSLTDLRMLAMAYRKDIFLAAGVPWYVALFGRDSCVTAFEMLAYQPYIARNTLDVLARYQGTEHNDFQDEEPGKILHELRVGEKANLHEVPQIPYYGTVDATPWFLMLIAQYVRWTGDMETFHQFRDNVERALQWIDANLSHSESGFLDYGTKSEKGLTNHGWKDSGNSIVNTDGSLAEPPIALVEVQGYAYRAKRAIAEMLRTAGEARSASQLEKEAEELKTRFNKQYWMADKHFYALAIQRGGRLAKAIASNPGQALFTGIVDDDKVKPVIDRLMAKDMYADWGIRTLSADEVAYNPLDYQVGSIWPHDNALIALGFWRSGFASEMERVFNGIFEAASHFALFRLPEVFDGFSQQEYAHPVHYPVACSPQAWASGAIPLLLQTALGLDPDATRHMLYIRRPSLPRMLHTVTVHSLKVGQAQVDLRYQRDGDVTLVAVLKREGDLTVEIEY